MTNAIRHPLASAVCGLILMLSALSAGCGRVTTEYGRSTGVSGRTSLNGFGALRRSYDQAGFRSRDVRRLSDRAGRVDTMVWTPRILGSINPEVTGWFDRWLRRGKRTLVYVVPDSGNETDYWMDTRSAAPPQQRLEYRRRAARSINQRMTWRMNRVSVPSNGWFTIEPLVERAVVGKVSGRWGADLKADAETGHTVSSEFRIDAFDSDKAAAAKAANPGAGFTFSGPTGPTAPWSMPSETTETDTPVVYTAVLNSEAGDPIVVQIRSRRWKDSQIIVVAGGSLLTNYAFTSDFGTKLADKLVAESAPHGDNDLTVGFILSDWGQIPVSEESAGIPQASGMELLTVWPLSLVTIHGVLLGLVICLMLWPVFGRPKRVQRANLSHFGDHLDAVAALMNKSGGEAYARARISEYMRRMHGETTGKWVLPEPPHSAAAASKMPAAKPATDVKPIAAATDPTQPATAVEASLPSRSAQQTTSPQTISSQSTSPTTSAANPTQQNETDR